MRESPSKQGKQVKRVGSVTLDIGKAQEIQDAAMVNKNNADVHTKWLPNADHLRHTHWLGLYAPVSSQAVPAQGECGN